MGNNRGNVFDGSLTVNAVTAPADESTAGLDSRVSMVLDRSCCFHVRRTMRKSLLKPGQAVGQVTSESFCLTFISWTL